MKTRDVAAEICTKLMQNHSIGHDGSDLYIMERPFFWRRLPEAQAGTVVRSLMYDDGREQLSTASISEGIMRYKQMLARILTFADQNSDLQHLIYINNGILDARTLMLYSPERIGANFRFSMNFSYSRENVGDSPNWMRFLESAFPDRGDIVRLQEFICGLITGRKPKCAYFLYGPSDSGKSVFAEFIKSLYYPSTACTAVGLEKFCDSFCLEELSHGHINIVTELSQDCFKAAVVENFKKIVAREVMTVSRKYHDPKEVRFMTTLLSCSNKPPKISPEDLDAVINRMEIIVFPKAIPKNQQIPNLKELLFLERDSIISQAFQQIPRLERNNYTLTKTFSSVQFMEQLLYDSPQYVLRDFFNDCFICQKGQVTPTADAIKAFRIYAAINGLGLSFSDKNIVRYFMAVNCVHKKKCRVNGCKSSIQCFVDITLSPAIVETIYTEGQQLFGDYCYSSMRLNFVEPKPAFTFEGVPKTQKGHMISEEHKVQKPFTISEEHKAQKPFTISEENKTKNSIAIMADGQKM